MLFRRMGLESKLRHWDEIWHPPCTEDDEQTMFSIVSSGFDHVRSVFNRKFSDKVSPNGPVSHLLRTKSLRKSCVLQRL